MVFDFLRSQFIEVIEWSDNKPDILAYQFPVANKEIKMGAQLTVRPGQLAVFVNEGQIGDIYEPGRYELETANMPILTKLKSWKYNFNSPFKAEVYFINTKELTDQKWGTTAPVTIRDADFKFVAVRSNGTFSYHVADPKIFVEKILGSASLYNSEQLLPQLRSQILNCFTDVVAETNASFLDLPRLTEEISELCGMKLQAKFAARGLEIDSFAVQAFHLPQEVQDAINQRGALGAVSDAVGTYSAIKTADAVKEAAQNPNGAGFAGMAAQMSAGMTIGQQFQQQHNLKNGMTKACKKCGVENNMDAKFCSECGETMLEVTVSCVSCEAMIPEAAKFCPECGVSQQPLVCSNCKQELATGAKFCPNCGTKC